MFIENSVLVFYLKLSDLIKHTFIFNSIDYNKIVNQLNSLELYNNINLFVEENNNFFSKISNFFNNHIGNALFINGDLSVYNKFYEYSLIFLNSFEEDFDVIIWGGEFENLDFNKLQSYSHPTINNSKLYNQNSTNPFNIRGYYFDKSVKINKIHSIIVSNKFLKTISNCNSLIDIVNKSQKTFIINPFVFEKKTQFDYAPIIKKAKKYAFKQDEHLGDNIFTLIFFNKLVELYPDLIIDFYVNYNNVEQLNLLKTSKNIQIKNILFENVKNIDYIGFGFDRHFKNISQLTFNDLNLFKKFYFEKYFKHFFNIDQILDVADVFYTNSNVEFIDIDYEYLLLNAKSYSGTMQYIYKEITKKFEQIADDLYLKNKKFISIEPIKNYPSTKKLYSNLIDIYKISKNFKTIIGFDTSPIIVALNKHNFLNIENFISLNENNFNYQKTIKNYKKISNYKDFLNLNI